MKIAITGHTKGIGQACTELLSQNHEVVGFSRSNGSDIKNLSWPNEDIDQFDVFINNAHYENHQKRILEILFERWSNTNKHIINVGSMLELRTVQVVEHSKILMSYREYKLALFNTHNKFVYSVHGQNLPLHLSYIRPCAVDTEMLDIAGNVGLADLVANKQVLTPQQVAECVKFMIAMPNIIDMSLLK